MAKINTNSNVYTIVYASVMVILVAFLLAYVSSSLKEKQEANVAIDKKTQILAALNVRGIDKADVQTQYNEHILSTVVLDKDGNIIDQSEQGVDSIGAFKVDTKEIGEKFPVYMAETADGKEALVLPVKGRGLWGGLWGYIAVTPDMQTVLGAYFNHESETAGLGALIKEEPFQSQFAGRPVFGEDGKVALTVVKKGTSESAAQVDGVTGATLTSKGTGEMVQSGLQAYADVLAKVQGCGKHEGCHGQAQQGCCQEQAQGCCQEQAQGCCQEQAQGCCQEQAQQGCCQEQTEQSDCCQEQAQHECQSGSECCGQE